MPARVRDWRTRLMEWGLAQRGRAFQWGETDCATLARFSLMLCFGYDVTERIPRWYSAREAARVLEEYSIEAELLRLGAEVQPKSFARGGDIILMGESAELGGVAMGVVLDGSTVLAAGSEEGVQFVSLSSLPDEAKVYSLWEAKE